jgi:hypothetical protein
MAKARTKQREPDSFQLDGNGQWTRAGAETDGRVIRGAILSGRTLTLSVQVGPDTYGVRMTSTDCEHFGGGWDCKDGSFGDANGTLFPTGTGYFFFGRWVEDGVYHWWFTLTKGEGFNEDGE